MRPSGDEAGDVSRVEHQQRSDLVGDLAKGHRIDAPGVGRRSGHDQLGTVLQRQLTHVVEVDVLTRRRGVVVARRDPVGDEVPVLRGDRYGRTVREVTALVEAHREDRVTGVEQRLVHGDVGVGPAVRLHVSVIGAEQRGEATPRQVLDLVDDLVAPVVPTAGIALGVLVRQHRSRGRQHGRRREVLARDQLKGGRLAVPLLAKQRGHLVIVGDPCVKWRRPHVSTAFLLDGHVRRARAVSRFDRGGDHRREWR